MAVTPVTPVTPDADTVRPARPHLSHPPRPGDTVEHGAQRGVWCGVEHR